jgi:amidase
MSSVRCLLSLVSMHKYRMMISLDDPKTFANAPVSIQVVGRTMEEEAVIAMSEVVDAALKSL